MSVQMCRFSENLFYCISECKSVRLAVCPDVCLWTRESRCLVKFKSIQYASVQVFKSPDFQRLMSSPISVSPDVQMSSKTLDFRNSFHLTVCPAVWMSKIPQIWYFWLENDKNMSVCASRCPEVWQFPEKPTLGCRILILMSVYVPKASGCPKIWISLDNGGLKHGKLVCLCV